MKVIPPNEFAVIDNLYFKITLMKTLLPSRVLRTFLSYFTMLFLTAHLAFGQVQLDEGFEGLIFPPTSWVESGNGHWSKQAAAAGYAVHSGSFAAYCNGAGSYLISPAININPADVLHFWYRVESNSHPQDFDVLIGTSAVSFTDTLYTVDGATNISYTEITLPLGAYAGQSVHIAFVGQSGSGAIFDFGLLLDDILVFGVPECAAATAPVDGATDVAVSTGLSWNPSPSADAYLLYFGTNNPPSNLENGTDLGLATNYATGGLNYSTTYYWQIVPYNVNGNATACPVFSFTTGIDPVIHTFPWMEEFNTWPPSGWNLSGGSRSWAPYGSTAAYCNFWNWPSGSALMTTPALNLSQDAKLNFSWSHTPLASFNDAFAVEISESGSGIWTSLWSKNGAALNSNDGATNVAPGTYQDETIQIPVSFTGKTVQLRFTGTSGNGSDLFLDKVEVEFDTVLSLQADDVQICFGETTTIEAIARGGVKPYTWQWSPAANLSNPQIANPDASPITTTTYTVMVTDANGATATATLTVFVNTMLSVDAFYNTTVCTSNLTQLYSTVTGGTAPYSYQWDNAATLSNAAIAEPFAFPSTNTTYNLTVTDAAGCQAFNSVSVQTSAQAIANIYPLSPEICAGDILRLTATGGTNYSWSSIPAGFSSTAASPFVAPLSTTQYVVQVGGACGTARDTVTVIVHPLPGVSFGPIADVCVDDAPFALTTGSPAGGVYAGTGVSGGTFVPSIAGAGTHTLSYSYTDLNGCINTTTQSITVHPLPVVSFSGLNPAYCISSSAAALFGSPAGGSFSGPGILAGDLFDPATAGEGNHQITYTYTDGNACTNAATQTVTVNPLPVISITNLNPAYCVTDPVTTIYGSEAPNGIFSGPGITDLGNGTATFNPVMAFMGTHTVTYSYVDGNGCANAVSQTVTVYPLPNVSYSGLALTYCANDAPATLIGNQAPFGSFTGHGITDLGNGTAIFDPAVAITFPAFLNRHEIRYTYTSADGCTNFFTLFVTVNPVPVANAGADQTICLGNVAQLNATAGSGTPPYSYQWDNAASLSNANIRNPIASPLASTLYTVTVTDFNGCQDTDDILITVNDPVAAVSDDTTCLGTPITLDVIASGGSAPYTYIWSPVAGLDNPFIQNPTANPAAAGDHIYSVTVTDAIGCAGSASLTLTVLPVPLVFNMTGGGAYCAGGIGVPVGLDGSEAGIDYTLILDGTATAIVLPGTGASLDFGLQTQAGVYTVLATHSNGCEMNMSGNATVVINENPSASVLTGDNCICLGNSADLTVNITGGLAPYTVVINDGSADFTVNAYQSGDPIAVSPASTTTYTLISVVDANGCASQGVSGTAIITVDIVPPTFTAPADITIYRDASCAYDASVTATGDVTDEADNCGVGEATFVDVVDNTDPCNVIITRTWSLVDDCGNAATDQVQIITVLDNTPPTFTAPADITIYRDASCAYDASVTATGDVTDEADNCGVGEATFVDVVDNTDPCNVIITRTWSLVDDCGNAAADQVQIITVQDNTPPSFSFSPPDVTINCVNADTSTASLGYPIVTDNCTGSVIITYADVVTAYTCPGDYSFTRTFTATDDCGNMSTAVQNVIVIDTLVISCPSDLVVCFDDAAFALSGGMPSGGTYTGSGVSSNTFDPAAAGLGVHTITYAYTEDFCCIHTCTFTITVNPNPLPFNVTGGGAFCAGGIGVIIDLDGSEIGILYQLLNNGVPSGPLVGGTGAQITFGYQTIGGTYTVLATNPGNSCTTMMNGSVDVTVHPLPLAFNVIGGGAYCSGGGGLDVGLDGSEPGVDYELYLYGVSTGQIVSGTGSAISFGAQTLAGNYTIHATNTSTSCDAMMNGSVTIVVNPNPVVFNVTGGGNYCTGGPGLDVGLDYSEAGVDYELIRNGANTGIILSGTGTALSFGLQTAAGTYTVFASNTTTGCNAIMNGSVDISINPLPLPFNVTGGGAYCDGNNGVTVELDNSQPGVDYELFIDGISSGQIVAGNGSPINFGFQSTVGTYTVVGTIVATGCTNNMLGSVTVTLYPAPMIFNVTGGGSYCDGGAGVVIGLDGSELGVDYELRLGGGATGIVVSGTGTAISFPAQQAAGSYSVWATGVATGCIEDMNGTADISIDPLPTAFNVTGGGNYCDGGIGLAVGIDGSQAGVTYELWLNGVATGQLVGGTGSPITFGNQIAAGTYTVSATTAATGCFNLMTGSAVINIDPLPMAFNVTGGGVICDGSSGADVGLDGSVPGILYQLQLDGVDVGAVIGGTGANLSFGLQVAPGTYTVVANNPITGCTNDMNGSVNIVVNPLPQAFNVTGGGDYCFGSIIPTVGLSGSETGVLYELYYNGLATGNLLGGTGAALNFGAQPNTGVYTVMANNTTTGCSDIMAGSVSITQNNLPTIFAITGGGYYCQSAGGIDVGLAGSEIGISYHLFRDGFPTTTMLYGTGSALSFGLQNVAGLYTVIATDTATGCDALMSGNTTVGQYNTPVATATSNSPVCEDGMIELIGGGAGCDLAPGVCPSTSTSWFQEYITNVSLNGAVQSSGGSNYTDYTANLFTSLFSGSSYTINVTNFVDGSFDQYVAVFIDWNRDGDFDDAGEVMQLGNFVGTHTFTYSFTVPATADVGLTQMRVVNQWGSAPSACGTFTYGETEDYMIEVKSSAAPSCQYNWSGPAGFTSADQYPVISPATSANAGTYTVTVTDANGCTASASTVVVVNPLPVVSFSGLVASYCTNDNPVALSGTPAGGTFSGQGISGSTFYPAIAGQGVWDITYTYENSFGCENSETMAVTVNPSPVATVSNDTTICQGGTAVVFASGGANYLWSNGSTNSAIFVSPLITTDYDVTVTNAFGCEDYATVTVFVNPVPLVNAGGDVDICLGESIQLDVSATGAGPVYGYQWAPPIGLNDPTVKSPMASPTVTTLYAVTVTSGNGCSASDDILVTVNPLPNADAGQDDTLCFGTTTTLTATPAGMSYYWSTGETTQNIVVVAGDTTTYFVTVTNSFGCEAVDSVTIASFGLPNAVASADQTICEFELAAISATGAGPGGTYEWSSVPAGFNATGANHIVMPADSTVYYVTVTDLNGCTDVDMTAVNVNPKPVVNVGPDQTLCENYSVTLDAGAGYDNYLWSNGSETQSITVDSSGVGIGTIVYSVTVTINGCAATDNVVLEFVPCPGLDEYVADLIDINVFPNPTDGRFTVTIQGFDKDVEMQMLNGLGQTIRMEQLPTSGVQEFSREFDLSDQPQGIYFLRFTDGTQLRTKKIIIH